MRGHRLSCLAAALIAGALAWLAAPAPAPACTCPPMIGTMRPTGDGAPLNAQVTFSVGLRLADLILVDTSTGASVAATPFDVGREFDADRIIGLRPDELLSPGTTYELRDGGQLLGSFTTGDAIDDTPPAAPELGAIAAYALVGEETYTCTINSCGSADQLLDVPLVDTGDAAHLLLEYRHAADGEPFAVLPWMGAEYPAWDGHTYRPYLCLPDSPRFDGYETLCVTAVAWDLAGNERRSAQQCITVAGCPRSAGNPCSPHPQLCSVVPLGPDAGPEADGESDAGCAAAPGSQAPLALLLLAAALALRRRAPRPHQRPHAMTAR